DQGFQVIRREIPAVIRRQLPAIGSRSLHVVLAGLRRPRAGRGPGLRRAGGSVTVRMFSRGGRLTHWLSRYTRWLHLRLPAGTGEPLPRLGEHGETSVPGLHVAGDLTGVPLLKLAVDSGARAVRAMVASLPAARDRATTDLVIVGAGPAGINAALEARSLGL